MHQPPTVDTISTHLYHSIDAVAPESWDQQLPPHSLFLSRSYLSAFQKSHEKEMQFRYLVIKKGDDAVGFAFCHIVQIEGPFLNEKEENKEDNPVRKYAAKKIKSRINRISHRMLVVGNQFITGQVSIFRKQTISRKDFLEALHQGVEQIKREEKEFNKPIGSIMIKDFPNEIKGMKESLAPYKYQQILAEPTMLFNIQAHWESFDDYLADFSSKYRVRAKKVIKKGKKLERRSLSVEEIVYYQGLLHELYTTIAGRAAFNLIHFNKAYLPNLKRELGDQFDIKGYFLDNELVGFTSNFIYGDELEAHFVGYRTDINRPHAIYNNILFDIIKLGIEHQIKVISFGRTAVEIKSTVGAVPHDMKLFVKHSNSLANRIIVPIVNYFRTDDWTLRQPFKNK